MPELPEVETIRRDLEKKILSKRILRLEVNKAKIIKGSLPEFFRVLSGNSFTHINRVGKLLMCTLKKGNQVLFIHLKMTGRLIYKEGKDLIVGGHSFMSPLELEKSKHTHVIFHFARGLTLSFEDLRQFGYFKLVSPAELEKVQSQFGIEPLTKSFTRKNFTQIFRGRKVSLKAVLLNQSLVAGIGNIYADEICFAAGILPSRPVSKLTSLEIKKLFTASGTILKEAIRLRGTTFYSYVDGHGRRGSYLSRLKVYQRQGQPCVNCRTPIHKTRLAGRGTHFCPTCQK